MLDRKKRRAQRASGLVSTRQYLMTTKFRPQIAVINREIKRLKKGIIAF
jgi:hypothetical protein